MIFVGWTPGRLGLGERAECLNALRTAYTEGNLYYLRLPCVRRQPRDAPISICTGPDQACSCSPSSIGRRSNRRERYPSAVTASPRLLGPAKGQRFGNDQDLTGGSSGPMISAGSMENIPTANPAPRQGIC